MKRGLTGLMIAMLATLWITPIAAQKNTQAEAMLAAAKQKETLEGDLNGAIKQYKEIVAKYAKTDRATAAMALVRMADAYRRMSDGESRKIYEQVVKDYPEQKDAVTLARAGLGEDSPTGPSSRTIWTQSIPANPGFDSETILSGTLSRDGRFFSYRRATAGQDRGDIFIHEIATGVDRNITNRPKDSKDFPYESVVSPDGKQVAYVWKTRPDNRYSLRLANLTGTPNPRVLYDSLELDAYDLYLHDWSPDGKSLVVELDRSDKTTKQIVLLSVSGGLPRVLKSSDWRGVGRIHFSPDGKYLGYDRPQSEMSKQGDVFVLAIDGTSETSVVANDSNDRMGGWSPDGKWLLFTSDRTGAIDLWAVAFADGKAQGAPQRVKTNIGENFRPMGWTASGALYYFTSDCCPSLNSRMQLASLDWSTGRYSSLSIGTRGYQENTEYPMWSPDGKSLAYLSSPRGSIKEGPLLEIRATDTGRTHEVRPEQLSKIFFLQGWSPDGRSLWVAANDKGGIQGLFGNGVYRVDATTGEVAVVVQNQPGISYADNLSGLAWMPEGRSFLTYAAGDKGGLYRVDAQTGASVFVFKQEMPPGAFSATPDGRTLYYIQAFAKRDLGPGRNDYAFLERDLATGNETELIRRNAPLKPSFSPDGRYCAITSADTLSNSIVVLLFSTAGENSPREVWRVPSEGKGNVAVVGWVQDGRSLLVRQDPIDRTRETELWLVPLSGGDPKRVVGDGSIPVKAGISLSPDGRHFAYTISEPAPPTTSEVMVLENFLPKSAKK